jgi:DNA-binding MarR family transcriptional regulator
VLTPAGRADIARFAPAHVRDLDELLGDALSDRQLAELATLLRTVRDHVRSLTDA